jgi:hypothetical protein
MADSNLGTWKLNLVESKFDPGPPSASETAVIEAWETDGIKSTGTRVLPDGTSVTVGWSAHYDGKDYKVTGMPDLDTIAYKRVDANTLGFTGKKNGKVVGTGTVVVSDNGKIRTTTGTMMNAKGQKVNIVAVYDKQ